MTRMLRGRVLRSVLVALLSALTTSITTTPASPPTSAPADPALRVSRHVAVGLEYWLVEPADVEPDAELPMIVFLHGRGDQPRVPERSIWGLRTPVRLILPRAPERFRQGYAWMPVSARRGESEALLSALAQRVDTLSQAMVEWRRRHPTRGRPIVAGFSQGGILAMTLAVREPESISRAIPMAGWIPPRFVPTERDRYAARTPIRALHGGSDPVIGAARTRQLVERLQQLGYPATYEEFPGVRHRMSREMQQRFRALVQEALDELPQHAPPPA